MNVEALLMAFCVAIFGSFTMGIVIIVLGTSLFLLLDWIIPEYEERKGRNE